MKVENTFIYLIGFSGTGKLTIAKELQKLVPAILVDNHLINNVVFSLIDCDGVTPLPDEVWDYTWQVRDIVLSTIRHLSKPERNFIFTNELIEGSENDAKLFEEIETLATQRRANLFPVRLAISIDELCKRIVSPERKSKLKAIDAHDMRERAAISKVFIPDHPNRIELDVTHLSAVESAKIIASKVRDGLAKQTD